MKAALYDCDFQIANALFLIFFFGQNLRSVFQWANSRLSYRAMVDRSYRSFRGGQEFYTCTIHTCVQTNFTIGTYQRELLYTSSKFD